MKKSILGAAFAAVTLTGAASASTVNVEYQSDGLFGSDNLQQRVRIYSPDYNGRTSAGLYHLTGDSGVGDFVAFCVDLAQYMRDPTTYTVDPVLYADPVVSNIKKLFNSVLGGSELTDVIDTSLEAVGFQLALWEIVTETASDLDVSSGAFRASRNAAATNQAQSYLDGLAGASEGNYVPNFLSSPTNQDIVTLAAVPLPASGLLMLIGLGGLAAARRRKAK